MATQWVFCVPTVKNLFLTPRGKQAVCVCSWGAAAGLTEVLLFWSSSPRKLHVHLSSHTPACHVSSPLRTLALHDFSVYVHRETLRKNHCLFQIMRIAETLSQPEQQHIFLTLLYTSPHIRGCWKIPETREMSFLAMVQIKHTASQRSLTKHPVINKATPA